MEQSVRPSTVLYESIGTLAGTDVLAYTHHRYILWCFYEADTDSYSPASTYHLMFP
jgi:hypothetical protein